MIAANGVTARYLTGRGAPSLRRVLRMPAQWGRIVELAAGYGEHLPAEPSARALNTFLERRRQADPDVLCRPVALRHQAAGTRRICAGVAGRADRRAFRTGGQRLHPLDGPQPALPGPVDSATAQVRPGRRGAALRARRNGAPWRCTARRRRTMRRKWSARSASRRPLLLLSRKLASDSMPSSPAPPTKGTWARIASPNGGRQARARLRGPRGGRPRPCPADSYRRGARLHRFRTRGMTKDDYDTRKFSGACLRKSELSRQRRRPAAADPRRIFGPAGALSPGRDTRHHRVLRVGAPARRRPLGPLLSAGARACPADHAVVQEPVAPAPIATSSARAAAAASWRRRTAAPRRPADGPSG